MYSKEDGPQCWEVDGTLCIQHVMAEGRHELAGMEKKEVCKLWGCPYYRAANPR